MLDSTAHRAIDATIIRRAMAVAAAVDEGDALATKAARAPTNAERKRLEDLMDATSPRLDRAVERMVIACRVRARHSERFAA